MAIRLFRKKDESDRKIKIPEGMWIKCDACLEIIYKPEVERNLNVCPKCVYHFRIPARERIRAVIDEGTFVEFGEEMESVDVLNFTDTKKYVDRLKEAKKKTGRKEAVITGRGRSRGSRWPWRCSISSSRAARWEASSGRRSPSRPRSPSNPASPSSSSALPEGRACRRGPSR